MNIVDRYIKDLRRALRKTLPRHQRDAVLAEVRAHLDERVRDLVAGGATTPEAQAAALEAFGPAREIAIQYRPEGSAVVRGRAGTPLLEVAMRTGAAAGRGMGLLARGVIAIVLALIGLVAVVAVGALFFAGGVLNTFEEEIKSNIPHPLYHHDQSGSMTARHTDASSDTFEVDGSVREFWFMVNIQPESTAPGCARVTLLGPDGSVAYDSGADCGAEDRLLSLRRSGTWTVRTQYVGFAGSSEVSAYYFER